MTDENRFDAALRAHAFRRPVLETEGNGEPAGEVTRQEPSSTLPPDFAAELEDRVPHVIAGTLERAVELAAAEADTSDVAEPVVLLSPACASFDQYRNFEIRGDKFRELVRALPGLTPAR